jgi:hypothetical protein
MVAGEVFLLFCAQAAAGILLILPLVSMEAVGRSFYQINVRVAVMLLVLGHGSMISTSGLPGLAFLLGLLSAISGYFYLHKLRGKDFKEVAHWLWITAGLSTLSLCVMIARSMEQSANQFKGFWYLLSLPCILSGAALLGSVTLSMILGHYYLNYPKLSITPLKRYNAALLLAAFSRAILFCAGVAAAIWIEIPTGNPDRGFFMVNALILLQRSLFGVIGPCLLAYMSWETVKIRSTQSATGILYAAMVLVAIGELTGAWFQVTAGLSL